MYTLVLMTAMSTAPATPQFDGYFRDLFRGCHGSCNGRDVRSAGDRASCQGSCHGGGLFQGRIRNFFSDLFDGRSCQGGCHGGCTGSRPREREPIARPYDRGVDPGYARGGCTGGGIAYGCNGGCYGSTPLYLGSCFGATPNYSCFGTSCMGSVPGLPPMSVPGYDFAPSSSAGFVSGIGAGGCDCLPGATTGLPPLGSSVPTMPSLPPLGAPISPDYGPIPSPGLPLPRTMPGGGFDSPAQPSPAEGGSSVRKVPLDDDATRGRVLVRLPADGKLFVEGKPLDVTNGERTFVTPPLPTDREAVYSFKVEYTRDGETVTHSRKVKVRANGTTMVDFADLIGGGVRAAAKGEPVTSLPPVPTVPSPPTDAVKAPVPTAPSPPAFDSRTTTKPADPKGGEVPTVKPPAGLEVAKITVKLPPGATLFVNGGKNDRSETVREFTTPTLAPNKVYQYTMRAELTRNGLPEYQESKVEFRAGDALTVDFTSLGEPVANKQASK